MSENKIQITANYSFWKHPIKWLRERKVRKILTLVINHKWENGMREDVELLVEDALLYGQAITKNGKRVDQKSL